MLAAKLDNRYQVDGQRTSRVEEAVNDHVAIIESMNKRVKGFVEQ